MPKEIDVKIAKITEEFLSIQNDNALIFDHLVKIDEGKMERFRQIQRDFMRMQNELEELINEK